MPSARLDEEGSTLSVWALFFVRAHVLLDCPQAYFSHFDRIAGGVADVDGIGAIVPPVIEVDLNTLGDEVIAPRIDFRSVLSSEAQVSGTICAMARKKDYHRPQCVKSPG